MKYIERIIKEKKVSKLGDLTQEACKIAEINKLGLLKTSHGFYRLTNLKGDCAYEDIFETLEEVDRFLKTLDEHADTKY